MDKLSESSLALLSATGGILSLLPVMHWPTLLTLCTGIVGLVSALAGLVLQYRRHRLQSRLEFIFLEKKDDEKRIRELEEKLARYESD